MHPKYAKCLEILCQKILRVINVLIELMLGIFHFFLKYEDWYIRYDIIAKFISTAFFNLLFKKKSDKDIDNEIINEA